jgi:hypothetical protein
MDPSTSTVASCIASRSADSGRVVIFNQLIINKYYIKKFIISFPFLFYSADKSKMQTSAEHQPGAPTENDEAIARAMAEAEAQQQRSRLWGRTHYHPSAPHSAASVPSAGLQTHHHQGLASSAPPALAAHPHHHQVGLHGGGQSPEDEDEDDDESVESLSQEAGYSPKSSSFTLFISTFLFIFKN